MLVKLYHYLINIIANILAPSIFTPPFIRRIIYNILGCDISKKAKIFPSCFLGINGKLCMGSGSFINYKCFLDLSDNINIGNNVAVGFGCKFITSFHEKGNSDCRAAKGKHAPITIADGCWIGANVTILPGVNIGKGCVIGANSLVIKDTEKDALYVGVPARKIKDLE